MLLCGAGLGSLVSELVTIDEAKQAMKKFVKWMHENYKDIRRLW
jgi:hypothetical protein